jgi:hypothetical protein
MYVCKYVPGANPTIFEFTATTPVEFLNQRKIIFNLKTHHAINSAVSFYNAGVVTRDRRIGSWLRKMGQCAVHSKSVNFKRLLTRNNDFFVHITAIREKYNLVVRPKMWSRDSKSRRIIAFKINSSRLANVYSNAHKFFTHERCKF